jgi:hypothetical protein
LLHHERTGLLRSRWVAAQRGQLGHEVFHILELPIYARKANVGDLIDVSQTLHYHPTDYCARDLGIVIDLDVGFDLGGQTTNLFSADGPLPACSLNPPLNFLALKWLASTILLDYLQSVVLDSLISGETMPTLIARSSPSDSPSIFASSGIENAVIVRRALRADHQLPFWTSLIWTSLIWTSLF